MNVHVVQARKHRRTVEVDRFRISALGFGYGGIIADRDDRAVTDQDGLHPAAGGTHLAVEECGVARPRVAGSGQQSGDDKARASHSHRSAL